MRLEHLLYEVLTETTSVQLIVLLYPEPISIMHSQGINHNICSRILNTVRVQSLQKAAVNWPLIKRKTLKTVGQMTRSLTV